jgi:TolA-binding protein
MKSIERHKLKENEFARSVAQARGVLETRKRDITVVGAVIVVLLMVVAGYVWWTQFRDSKANDMLASALAVYEAPVVTEADLPKPAPGSPLPIQPAGTFPSEQAKLDAALPKLMETADTYPSTGAGLAARYTAASALASLGRYAEAEQRYQEVADKAGRSIYGRTARLGVADVQVAQGKYDSAINIYTEISRDPNAQIPVDGVLMQLGRAYTRAGKKDEAAGAFNRVINDFPESLFTADARRELELVKKS